jgi:hypothetical protein
MLDISEQLKPGGYYKPPLCIQEYVYYLSNQDEITHLAQLDFNQFDQVKNFSYNLIKKHYEYSISMREKIKNYINVKQSQFTVIIIPFRNREHNLIDLFSNLHSFLQRQYLHYRIIVAEQHNKMDAFNKGRLYNTAYRYIMNLWGDKVKCLILHDVDLTPESDYNIYECDNNFYNELYLNDVDASAYTPRHLSYSIRQDTYFDANTEKLSDVYIKSPYELLVGGVLCIQPQVFDYINGFSNEYWNWGAEDDGKLIFNFFTRNSAIFL